MREIKFRGKSDDGKWHYGDLLQYNDGTISIGVHGTYIDDGYSINDGYNCIIEVEEDSVGQFTGIKDRNGNDIYEGDTLKWTVRNRSKNRKGTHKPYKKPQERIGTVVWSLGGLRLKSVDYPDAKWNYVLLNPQMNLEVIGNIHDKDSVE